MLLNNIHSSLPDKLITENVPLSKFSSLGVGGNAEFFAQPNSPEELREILRSAENMPVYVIGSATNILIPDGKINGLTISTSNLNSVTWLSPCTAEIQSGFSLPLLLRTLREKNLGGLEFSAGIPGTLGGAVSGNAGAGGHGVCEFVDEVKAVDASGNVKTFGKGDFTFAYRNCSLSSENVIILSVKMTFRKALPDDADVYADFMAKRKSQPLNFRSAGCTFKNPENGFAGKLLDECGCKGLSSGGAEVSSKHANFIINKGNASSKDISALIDLCTRKVYELTGIKLETEIKLFTPVFTAR